MNSRNAIQYIFLFLWAEMTNVSFRDKSYVKMDANYLSKVLYSRTSKLILYFILLTKS